MGLWAVAAGTRATTTTTFARSVGAVLFCSVLFCSVVRGQPDGVEALATGVLRLWRRGSNELVHVEGKGGEGRVFKRDHRHCTLDFPLGCLSQCTRRRQVR